jgi:hypothetical protein
VSGLLNHLSEDFSRRMEVRRGMLAHLGLSFTDDEATELRGDLRRTLLCCASCGNPDVCRGWVTQNQLGTPMFCQAREAFARLDHATRREETRMRA